MSGPSNAQLQELLTETTKRATDAEARVATLTADLASANERADAEGKARQDADQRADALTEELRGANASLKAYKGSATRLRAQATILKRELSPQARPIGALKPAKTEDDRAARAEALEAAFALDTAELVFSDGKREIRELAPLLVTGDAWFQTPRDRELADDIILEPIGERQSVELAGFALLNEAGEQVGYCQLMSPIVIGRGQHMRIPRGSIRF